MKGYVSLHQFRLDMTAPFGGELQNARFGPERPGAQSVLVFSNAVFTRKRMVNVVTNYCSLGFRPAEEGSACSIRDVAPVDSLWLNCS